MKQLILLVAFFAAANAIGNWNDGLKVRFDVGLFGAGRSFFIPIPRTVTKAKNSRWVETARPSSKLPSLLMYCPSRNDVVVCGLYDDLGDVAGLQIALPVDSYESQPFDWTTQGFTSWAAPANTAGVRKTYWTIQQYFVSEKTLKLSKEERLATRATNKLLKEDAVWVSSFYGELMKISAKAKEVIDTPKTLFTKQACVPFMGQHYYYNMTVLTECTADKFLPWFPMVDERTNQLIATGFMSFGKLPAKSLVKNYFESPTQANVKIIVPNGPQCIYDLAKDPGVVTMHIYYIDSPQLISCLF